MFATAPLANYDIDDTQIVNVIVWRVSHATLGCESVNSDYITPDKIATEIENMGRLFDVLPTRLRTDAPP